MDFILYECGICGCLHNWEWDGDCREDYARFVDTEDFVSRVFGATEYNIEVRSWEDRLEEDAAIYS